MTGALAPEVRRWPSAAEAAALKGTCSARLKPCPSNTLKRVVQQLLVPLPLNSCRRWQEIFEHIVFGQYSRSFGAISETAHLFGIRNAESDLIGSGCAGLASGPLLAGRRQARMLVPL